MCKYFILVSWTFGIFYGRRNEHITLLKKSAIKDDAVSLLCSWMNVFCGIFKTKQN